MLTEEDRRKYKTLLLGIGIGMIGGFLVAWLMNDPIDLKPTVGSFGVTFLGCFITIGFVLVYLYIAEWSKLQVAGEKNVRKEVA